MKPVFRLDSVSPTLAESFRRASPANRRQAARVACELAVSSAGLTDPEVAASLDALCAGAPAEASLRAELERLADRFDDEYLRLEEDGDHAEKSEALRLFWKARAASALAFALSGDDAKLHEAIYEALAAMADPSELVRAAEIALG